MGVIDSLAIYRIAAILGADPFHLGVMSSLWSAAFIAGAFVFGYIGDRYWVGVLKILSSILSIFSLSLVLFSSDTVLIIAGYVAHALALSCGRIAISITILESIDPEAWGRINSILRGIYWILRGLVVYLLLGMGFGDSIVAIMAAISLGLILTLPEPYYRRLYYRIEGLLSRIYQGLNGSSLVLITDSWGDIYSSQIITRLWGGLRDESPPSTCHINIPPNTLYRAYSNTSALCTAKRSRKGGGGSLSSNNIDTCGNRINSNTSIKDPV